MYKQVVTAHLDIVGCVVNICNNVLLFVLCYVFDSSINEIVSNVFHKIIATLLLKYNRIAKMTYLDTFEGRRLFSFQRKDGDLRRFF